MLIAWVVLASTMMVLCFIGWGQLIAHNDDDTDFAMAAAYGLAGACVIGGILNWFHLISQLSIGIFLATGILIWAVCVAQNLEKCQRAARNAFSVFKKKKTASILFGALLLLNLAYSSLPKTNEHDDNQAYLVFPNQMLDTGHIGDDPFNERRLTVLGAQSFLNAMMLTFVPNKQVRALDGVVGWLVFIMLVMIHSHRRKLSWLSLLLLLSIWNLVDPPAINVSSLLTSLALFYAFLRRFQDPGLHGSLKEVVKTGILVAALCALKNSNVVGLGFLGASVFLLDRRMRFPQGLAQGIKVAVVGFFLVFPWMLASFQSSGTFFFPLLGHGTQTSLEHGAATLFISAQTLNWSYVRFIFSLPLLLPTLLSGLFLLLLGLLKYKQSLREINPAAMMAFLAAVLGVLCLAFTSQGHNRYSYPFSFAAFVFLVTEALANTAFDADPDDSRSSMRKRNRFWLAWLTIAFYAGAVWSTALSQVNQRITAVRDFTDQALLQFPREVIEMAQKSTPPGSSILAVLSHPYQMDFGRNRVFVVDHAGSASPDPGLPISGPPEAIAVYLRTLNINYLMYSYADEGGYGFSKYSHRLNRGGSPYSDRVRMLAENNFKFRRQLVALSKTYKIIYKDDYSFVIDLTKSES